MSKIKVIMCPVDRAHDVTWIENRLHNLQAIVGGYIEVVNGGPVLATCNEEAMILEMPFNPSLPDFRGPVIVCGRDGEEFASITDPICGVMLRTVKDRFKRKLGVRPEPDARL